jgi:hypothetical protein
MGKEDEILPRRRFPVGPPCRPEAELKMRDVAPANQPLPRDGARHKAFLEIAKAGNIDLLFLGDSITDWFANPRGPNPSNGSQGLGRKLRIHEAEKFGIAVAP